LSIISTAAEADGAIVTNGTRHVKKHLMIDRDTKYGEGCRQILASARVNSVLCPPRVAPCNAFAERFVRSRKHVCVGSFL